MSAVPLGNVVHAGLRLRPRRGPEFGDPVGQVAIFPSEFAAIQREYPILFHRTRDGQV